MDITVTFQDGRWITDPSPAIVAVGTRVRWIFRGPDLKVRTLLWKVSFQDRIPFGKENAPLEVKTQLVDLRQWTDKDHEVFRLLNLSEEAEVSHRGITAIQSADRPGDFKYDLSVEDADTGKKLGDDDPWLIVVRGIVRPFDFYAF